MTPRALLTIAVTLLLWGTVEMPSCRAADGMNRLTLGFGRLTTAGPTPGEPQIGLLTARYRLISYGNFRPYLATGVGYSLQPDETPAGIDRLRTGVAGQAGFSYLLGEKTTFTLDYKLLDLGPEAQRGRSAGTPQSIGMGLEIHF